MRGNDRYREERAARTAAEQWAGAKLVAKNMAEGLLEEVCKKYKIPPPVVHVPTPNRATWEVHARYYVEGVGDVTEIEPFAVFPSNELKTKWMLLGLER